MLSKILTLLISAALGASVVAGPATTELSFGRSAALTATYFTQNEGQWDSQVLFHGNIRGTDIWLTNSGVYYQLSRVNSSVQTGPDPTTGALRFSFDDPDAVSEEVTVRTVFEGAASVLRADGLNKTSYVCNYYFGSDPSGWREQVANYSEVQFTNVYPGIDCRYYYSASDLEYDLIVNPGSDPNQIAIKWEGPSEIALNDSNELVVTTRLGSIREHAPLMYQVIDGENHPISGQYRLLGPSIIGFSLSGDYRHDLPLIIDPVLQYSSYVGGGYDDIAYGLALDPDGYMYLTGATKSPKFPTYNAYDSIFTGSNVTDVFVTKLSPDGSSLVYSTFLGGGGGIDEGRDIAANADGSAYITGRTSSSGFPVLNAYDVTLGGTRDAFVTKLSSTGTLNYSTFLGGTVADEGYGITVDASGNAYVTGSTQSANFPVVNAYDAGYNGQYDVFVTKLAPTGSSLVFSTFMGGSANEQANGIDLDGSNNIYLAGFTNSSNFPRLNAYDSSYNGADDIFVAKLAAAGKPLMYSTFLGGAGYEQASAIAVGPNNTAFVTGYTTSPAFPTKNAYSTSLHGGSDAVGVRINATGSGLVYSTYLGGSAFDYGYGIAVDSRQDAYIVGSTTSSDFPTIYAYDSVANGGDDIFIAKLQSTGSVIDYSTLLGGAANDEGFDIAIDNNLAVYIAGASISANYPVANSFDSTVNGGYDVVISKLTFDERNCCVGLRGNVNGDPLDAVDISDLIFFIDYSFEDPSGPEPPCPEEADVDGNGAIDVADVIFLVDYMFNGGSAPTVACQ